MISLPDFENQSAAANRTPRGRAFRVVQNSTKETFEFTKDAGLVGVANRGALQKDIFMSGLRYVQTVEDADQHKIIHKETGFWLSVPATSDPVGAASVIRQASIPHGVTVLMQGVAKVNLPGTQLTFDKATIEPEARDGIALGGAIDYFGAYRETTPPLLALENPTDTELSFTDINAFLRKANSEQTVLQTTTLTVQSAPPGIPLAPGRGPFFPDTLPKMDATNISNMTFLQPNPDKAITNPNNNAAVVFAYSKFWINYVQGSTNDLNFMQLMYTQTVVLNFGGAHWPHISVAILTKQL